MDKIDADKRSRNMARIKAKNTKPELLLRTPLYKLGFRYRIHYPLEGKPDIVFPKKKIAIFVNGCFWHGHNCKMDHVPKSNTDYWKNKVERNTERDRKIIKSLSDKKWKVVTVWECDIYDNLAKVIKQITKLL